MKNILINIFYYVLCCFFGTQYGLYSAFMCCFVYVLLGTSRDINFGPTAVMSLLTAEFAHSIPALATLLAFICGLIQIGMGVFSLGQ